MFISNAHAASSTESNDNQAVIDVIGDKVLLIKRKLIPTAARWLKLLTRAGGASQQQQSGELLRELLDKRDQLNASLKRCRAAGVAPRSRVRSEATRDDSDEDDEDMEDVEEKRLEDLVYPPTFEDGS